VAIKSSKVLVRAGLGFLPALLFLMGNILGKILKGY